MPSPARGQINYGSWDIAARERRRAVSLIAAASPGLTVMLTPLLGLIEATVGV